MALDPPQTRGLEEASWSLANRTPVCLTTEQYPQDSYLLGMESQTMVRTDTNQFIVKPQDFNLLYCYLCVHLSKHVFSLSPF